MIEVIKVTKNDFYHDELPIIFHDEEYARNYYNVSYNGEFLFSFSAQSEILPTAVNIDGLIAVGCDQDIVFFSVKDSSVIKKIPLSCFFYYFYLTDEYVSIVCEVEIILLKRKTLYEYTILTFTKYIDHMGIDESSVFVKFVDDSIEYISI
ncbi:MAG TPA: hypothetical protein DGZ94_10315 [Serratia sp.]|nr:hypothetical protein [Serratia sp. (in: enterobacteria)]